MILLPTLATGGCVVTVARPDPDKILDMIEHERLTRVMLHPPKALAAVLDHPRRATVDASGVERGLPPQTDALGSDTDPNAWNPSYTTRHDVMGLGMSETFMAYWWGTPDEADSRTPPLHRLSDGWEIRVVDEMGQRVADGQVGEILVRGPSLCQGLQKVEPSTVFDRDGWYRTGDRGLVDGESIRFRGRDGDVIKTAGANVSAAEVEAALCEVEGVLEAFVVGVPDHDRGAVPAAAVVIRPGAGVTEQDLLQAMAAMLASYKRPRMIRVFDDVDAIPMTPTGKKRIPELQSLLADGGRTQI